MAKVTIKDVPPFDGDYELDTGYFTNREFHLIKQVAGVRAGELDEALSAGDTDLMVALASIAVRRSGREVPVDVLWDAKLGAIEFDFTEAEDEEPVDEGNPPPPQPTVLEPNGNGGGVSGRSGETSDETSVSPV